MGILGRHLWSLLRAREARAERDRETEIVRAKTQRLDVSFSDFDPSAEAVAVQRAARAAGEVC